MGDRKYAVGTLVMVDGKNAIVVRHGRDAANVYTEIRYDDGTTERVHRSTLKPVPSAEER